MADHGTSHHDRHSAHQDVSSSPSLTPEEEFSMPRLHRSLVRSVLCGVALLALGVGSARAQGVIPTPVPLSSLISNLANSIQVDGKVFDQFTYIPSPTAPTAANVTIGGGFETLPGPGNANIPALVIAGAFQGNLGTTTDAVLNFRVRAVDGGQINAVDLLSNPQVIGQGFASVTETLTEVPTVTLLNFTQIPAPTGGPGSVTQVITPLPTPLTELHVRKNIHLAPLNATSSAFISDIRQSFHEVGVPVVPEPSTMALLASGGFSMLICGWRNRKRVIA